MPLSNVEVAVEERLIEPPVIVSPDADESPPIEPTDIPPANVEVAVEEACMGLLRTLNPPANSEVLVVDVATTNPNAGEVVAERVKVWVAVSDEAERLVHAEEGLLKENVWDDAVSPLSEVIAVKGMQLSETEKQPPVRLMPEAKVDVELELVCWILPPVIVRPEEVAEKPAA